MAHESRDTTPDQPSGERIVAIDALRGFDMFWILGAGSLVRGLRSASDTPWVSWLATQLEHVAWEGCRFYDVIFPLFVFLMGASTVFSLRKILQRDGLGAAYRRLIWRAVVLYCLGIIYYGGISRDGGPEMFRYVGVLQRIAICYLAGGLLLLNLRLRGLVLACATLLIGYWALMTFVPVPSPLVYPHLFSPFVTSTPVIIAWSSCHPRQRTIQPGAWSFFRFWCPPSRARA